MKTQTRPDGFSLVEVTMALGVAGFCLLAIFGLLPAGVNSNHTSFEQNAAANLATRIATDLEATPASDTTTPNFALPMSGDTTIFLREDGSRGMSVADGRYRARVVTSAGSGGQHAATMARIVITWPAAADPTKRGVGAFETVIALNRN